MTGELAKLLKEYNDSERIADTDFVNRICSLVIHKKNMEKFLHNVIVVNNAFFKEGEKIKHTTYYLKSHLILVNLDDDHSVEAALSMSDKHYIDWYNAGVLDTALHELEHVEQEKERTLNPTSLKSRLIELNDIDIRKPNKRLYTKLIKKPFVKILNEYYDTNHDLAPVERMAELESIEQTDQVLKAYGLLSYGLREFQRCQACCKEDTLLEGYKLNGEITNAPSLDFLERMPHTINKKIIERDPMFRDTSLPFEERVLYGLPLTKDEFAKVKTLSR